MEFQRVMDQNKGITIILRKRLWQNVFHAIGFIKVKIYKTAYEGI